ncbi:site-specific DNA-methyltransferase [Novosphingobium sp.]|uniref:site-specific DNA-methyltransferase n=1 Tax=Novosphingobium sp. TaxID=1874826 RepID=UPI003D0E0C27
MTSSKRSPSKTNLPAIIDFNKWHNWPEGGPTIHIRYVPPETLKPPKRQLRKHSKKQLGQIEASLRRFGFTNPIQVDADNRIVAGVGRWLAALEMKLPVVPVVSLDHLSKTDLRLLAIADNKLAMRSDWDNALLSLELGELSIDLDLDIDITGFEAVEIDRLHINLADEEAVETVELPADDAVAVARAGDLFALGEHRLLCGDARDPEAYPQLLLGKKARMVFADAPYNVKIKGNVSGLGNVKHREFVMGSGEMSRRGFVDFLAEVNTNLVTHSVDGAIHFQCIDWRHSAEMQAACERLYTEFKNLIVWSKDNAGMGTFYRSQHELIQVWKVGTAPHTNNFGLGETGRFRSNVWFYPGANTMRKGRLQDLAVHPTVKPTTMVAEAIRDVSKRGEIVLDPFCGSGTTILAAERTGRRARCIELDPLYVDAAIKRWEDVTGAQAIHVQSGLTFGALRIARLGEGK